MGTGRELVKTNARRKGWAAAWIGTVTVGTSVAALSLGMPIIAGLAAVGGGVVTAQKTYEWLKYRGTWGLRF